MFYWLEIVYNNRIFNNRQHLQSELYFTRANIVNKCPCEVICCQSCYFCDTACMWNYNGNKSNHNINQWLKSDFYHRKYYYFKGVCISCYYFLLNDLMLYLIEIINRPMLDRLWKPGGTGRSLRLGVGILRGVHPRPYVGIEPITFVLVRKFLISKPLNLRDRRFRVRLLRAGSWMLTTQESHTATKWQSSVSRFSKVVNIDQFMISRKFENLDNSMLILYWLVAVD